MSFCVNTHALELNFYIGKALVLQIVIHLLAPIRSKERIYVISLAPLDNFYIGTMTVKPHAQVHLLPPLLQTKISANTPALAVITYIGMGPAKPTAILL